jgi:putative FmdB family regulatory protein
MPTYGYECKSCGHTFDVFQSMSEEPLKVCPECGKEVRRLINGGTGVIFKGSGFYVTDKGKGGSVVAPAKSSAKSPPAESSTGVPPAKPADKPAGDSADSKPKAGEVKQPVKS